MSLKATGPDRAVMSLKAPGSEALNTINYGKRGKKMNNKSETLYLKQIFEETDPGDLSNAQDPNNKIEDKPGQLSADDKLGNDDKKYSDADLDRIISQKFAKWQKEQDKKVSEATSLMSAKSYKAKFVDPLISKLKSLIKTIFARWFSALDDYHRLNVRNGELYRENEKLTKINDRLKGENYNLRGENRDYKLLRKVFGSRQIDSLLEQTKQSKQRKKRFRNTQNER